MEAARDTKDQSFEEKQKELIEKWNAVWGKKDEKKEEPKPVPKVERPPVVHYCEGGLGFLCPNKATVHVYCDTDALYYQQYLCTSCWKWNHLFGKRADELPEGLRIFKIEGSTEILEAGRARSKLESKLPQKEVKAKEEKKTPLLESKGEIAFIFPGQGAQEVGMTKDVQSIPGVKKLFDTASSVLGYDLADLVLKGPKEKLDTTEFSQPAMLIAGLAAIEKLRADDEKVVTQCTAAAGLSLGEYTALVFAGALSLEDALKVVKVRGQAMNKAALSQKGGMVSVVGLDDTQLNKICEGARAYAQAKDTDKKQSYVCELANLNFPSGRVVSGHDVCMEYVVKAAEEKGAKASKLHVSGAFHTELMSSASKALEDVLHDVVVQNPRIPVYANTTGEVYKSAEDIRTGLVKQLVSPVRWEQCVDGLLRDGRDHLYELGPRNQLSAMVRKQNPQAYKLMKNIRV